MEIEILGDNKFNITGLNRTQMQPITAACQKTADEWRKGLDSHSQKSASILDEIAAAYSLAIKLHVNTREIPMRVMVYSVAIALVALMWWTAINRGPATFKERFQPAIDYPLHIHGLARQGFCFPGTCRVAMMWTDKDFP